MELAVDKAFVLVLCACLSALGGHADAVGVAWLAAAVALTSLVGLMRVRSRAVARAVAVVVTCVVALAPGAMAALPLAAFELALVAPRQPHAAWLCTCAGACVLGAIGDVAVAAITLAATAVSVLLALREMRLTETRSRLHETEDELSDRLLAVRVRNHELEDALAETSRAATRDERMRIAHEVHDGVGHGLTRLIYQVAALKLAHRDDDRIVGELDGLQSGLGETMDAMRTSVHALDDHATDLRAELSKLAARSGPNAQVSVDYDLEGAPGATTTRHLVALAREALTNAERHAHARAITVRVREFPGLWQLSIENDGDMPPYVTDEGELMERGLGLRSMRERVESLGGTFRASFDTQRFRVFASIPRRADA